jgi:hypothetical protein
MGQQWIVQDTVILNNILSIVHFGMNREVKREQLMDKRDKTYDEFLDAFIDMIVANLSIPREVLLPKHPGSCTLSKQESVLRQDHIARLSKDKNINLCNEKENN